VNLLVGDDADAIERCCGGHTVREKGGDGGNVLPAHAMPDAPDRARLHFVLGVEIGEQRGGIIGDALVGQMVHRGTDHGRHPVVAARNVEMADPESGIHVRQHAEIAVLGDPTTGLRDHKGVSRFFFETGSR